MGRWCWGNQFHFQDKDGFVDKDDFYGDNEFPYIDIRLYPQDNWKDIIAAYVRKNATPGIFESIRVRMPNVNTS